MQSSYGGEVCLACLVHRSAIKENKGLGSHKDFLMAESGGREAVMVMAIQMQISHQG